MKNIIISILVMMCVSSCGDDDCMDITNFDCSNYDFCVAVPEPVAGFTWYHEVGFRYDDKTIVQRTLPKDTTYGGQLTFEAFLPEDIRFDYNNSYTWQIGEDSQVLEGETITRYFGREFLNNDFLINHTMTKRIPNCPDRLVESNTKSVNLHLAYHEELPPAYTGKWVGKDEGNPNEYTIEVIHAGEGSYRVLNFPFGGHEGEDVYYVGTSSDYKSFLLVPSRLEQGCCPTVYGVGDMENGVLTIDYHVYDWETKETTDYTWTGRPFNR